MEPETIIFSRKSVPLCILYTLNWVCTVEGEGTGVVFPDQWGLRDDAIFRPFDANFRRLT